MNRQAINFLVFSLLLLLAFAGTVRAESFLVSPSKIVVQQNNFEFRFPIDRTRLDSLQRVKEQLLAEYDRRGLSKSNSVLEYAGSSMWAGILSLEMYGDVVYALNYHGLQIFDMNDPATLIQNIYVENGQYYDQMILYEHYLYFGRANRLYIYDLTDPYNPEQMNILTLDSTTIAQIYIRDNRLYLGSNNRIYYTGAQPSFYIYDITDPAYPVYIGGYIKSGTNVQECQRFVIVGDTVFSISQTFDNIEIFDISDETNPQYIFRTSFPDDAWDIDNIDKYIFVITDEGICVYDMSNPTNPDYISLYESTGNWAIEAAGDTLFISSYDGIRVLRLADKGFLEEITTIEFREPWFTLNVIDTLILSPCHVFGFDIIDIADLFNTSVISSYATGTYNQAGIAVTGDWVYTDRSVPVSGDTCKPLNVCNIAEKEKPVYIGDFDGLPNSYDLAAYNNRLYYPSMSTLRGLETYNIDNPIEPTYMCQSDSISKMMFRKDSLLFVAGQYKGLYIYNLATTGCPDIVAQILPETDGFIVESSCADDNYIYTIELDFNSYSASTGAPIYFRIIDYSDINNPFTTGLFYISTEHLAASELVQRGNIVYVASGYYGVAAIDVSNPYQPFLAGHYDPEQGGCCGSEERCSNLSIKGFYLFLAINPSNVVQVVDIGNPSSPTPVEYIRFPASVSHLDIVDDYLYSCCNTAMYIHKVGMPEVACGDCLYDGNINIFDVTSLISYLYRGGASPYPLNVGDVNNDSTLNIFDVTYLISYLYLAGPPPNCP